MQKTQQYTILAFTENTVGLLNRISIIFTRRKINIDSFNASESEIKGIYSFCIVVSTTHDQVMKVVKQIEKLVEVLKAFVYTGEQVAMQEMALYKVSIAHLSKDHKLEQIIRTTNARILNVDPEYIIIEKTGHAAEIDDLFEKLHPYDVQEFMRTARVVITKPMKKLSMFLREMDMEEAHKKPVLPKLEYEVFSN